MQGTVELRSDCWSEGC